MSKRETSQPPCIQHIWPPSLRQTSKQASEAQAYIHLTLRLSLDRILRSPSPLLSKKSWHTKTPSNTLKVDKQTTLVETRKIPKQLTTLLYEAIGQLAKCVKTMAGSVAPMRSQVDTLQQANEAMYIRQKRKRQVPQSNKALSVGEIWAMADQEQVESQIVETP